MHVSICLWTSVGSVKRAHACDNPREGRRHRTNELHTLRPQYGLSTCGIRKSQCSRSRYFAQIRETRINSAPKVAVCRIATSPRHLGFHHTMHKTTAAQRPTHTFCTNPPDGVYSKSCAGVAAVPGPPTVTRMLAAPGGAGRFCGVTLAHSRAAVRKPNCFDMKRQIRSPTKSTSRCSTIV